MLGGVVVLSLGGLFATRHEHWPIERDPAGLGLCHYQRMRTRKLTVVAAGAAALGLFLSACGGGDDTEEPAGGTDEDTSEQEDEGGVEEEAEEDDAEVAEDEAAEDEAAAGGEGAECLIGTWSATGEDLESQIGDLGEGEESVAVEGEVVLTIDETTYTQVSDMLAESEVEGQPVSFALDATVTFSYTATDEAITFDEMNDVQGTFSASQGDETMDVEANELFAELEGTSVNYQCSDTELSVQVDDTNAQVYTRQS